MCICVFNSLCERKEWEAFPSLWSREVSANIAALIAVKNYDCHGGCCRVKHHEHWRANGGAPRAQDGCEILKQLRDKKKMLGLIILRLNLKSWCLERFLYAMRSADWRGDGNDQGPKKRPQTLRVTYVTITRAQWPDETFSLMTRGFLSICPRSHNRCTVMGSHVPLFFYRGHGVNYFTVAISCSHITLRLHAPT